MKKSWKQISIACATALVSTGVFAQSNSGMDQTTTDNSSSAQTKSWSSRSSISRSSQNAARVSNIIGSQVNDASGSRIGQIEDIIVNPSSGRIDCAVISLNSGVGGASSPSATSSGSSSELNNSSGNSSSTTSSYSRTSGKLVPVPWSLLHSSSSASGSSSDYASSSSGAQQNFTLNVDQSKLNSAPTIENGQWSQINQSNWRERVYSHFGLSGSMDNSSSTGSAESPSGTQKGAGAKKLMEGQPATSSSDSQSSDTQ